LSPARSAVGVGATGRIGVPERRLRGQVLDVVLGAAWRSS
jgi:hypothetical protein